MSKILEMRQKRAEVWDKARAFLDEHTNENGVMSAEDSQQYERMEQEVVDLVTPSTAWSARSRWSAR